MIADKYPDDESRSKVMGVALGGIAMGVLSMIFIFSLIIVDRLLVCSLWPHPFSLRVNTWIDLYANIVTLKRHPNIYDKFM